MFNSLVEAYVMLSFPMVPQKNNDDRPHIGVAEIANFNTIFDQYICQTRIGSNRQPRSITRRHYLCQYYDPLMTPCPELDKKWKKYVLPYIR